MTTLLLDTHAVIWWFRDDPSLSSVAHAAISDPANAVVASAASAWEITTKHRRGKLPEVAGFVDRLEEIIEADGFTTLPLSFEDARGSAFLPSYHSDPFDRMLIAQALARGWTLVSNERLFDRYGVSRLW